MKTIKFNIDLKGNRSSIYYRTNRGDRNEILWSTIRNRYTKICSNVKGLTDLGLIISEQNAHQVY